MKITSMFLLVAALALGACESQMADKGSATGGAIVAPPPVTGAGAGPVSRSGAPRPGSQEEFTVAVGDRVFFDFDRYDLRPDARATLEKQAAWLKIYPRVTITVEGHCDERGTREYNLALGERRATSAKNYLIALGVTANRIDTISYGKERPMDPRPNDEAQSRNRRGVSAIRDGATS